MIGLTVFGVETSCDDTACAVVRLSDGQPAEVLAAKVFTQNDAHAPYGGVVPEIAARAHAERLPGLAAETLQQAGLTFADIDAIAATAGPGLIGGVVSGLSFAKGLSLALGKPLIAVNHLEGHALSARLSADVDFPFLLLLASGGHCQLLDVQGVGACKRLGTTLDDAAGEAFDKIGKVLGLPYPGGPALEAFAVTGDPARYVLPRMLIGRKTLDFSFSGLKTAAAKLALSAVNDQDRADLAAAVQAAIAAQLAERTALALDQVQAARGPGRFVVAGGVAANKAVRAALEQACADRDFSFFAPPLAFCTDNAAMIALAGAERLKLGLISDLNVAARPRWPLDEVAATASPTHPAGRKGAKA